MNGNGYLHPAAVAAAMRQAMGLARVCTCGQSFTARFAAERYCSNACALRHGTATLPAAAPIERPRTARTPRPQPDPPKPPDPPLAIVRMRRWVDEHPARA